MTASRTRTDVTTRFAPSPTGLLHLGHAYAALFAFDAARNAGGRFLLRIEDIDAGRCRPEFEAAIYEDLAWLGLEWETPVRRQSQHMADYEAALDRLGRKGLLYPCFCSRRDIAHTIEAAEAAHLSAPHSPLTGPDGVLYPGTCRHLSDTERKARMDGGAPFALRLDVTRAQDAAGTLSWIDEDIGEIDAHAELFGDVVLARKDTPTSYHLAVTIDDAIQGVSLVTRGQDLFDATHIHRLLQHLLGLSTPVWHHHPMVLGEDGARLAKRDQSLTLRALRENGVTPDEIRRRLGLLG